MHASNETLDIVNFIVETIHRGGRCVKASEDRDKKAKAVQQREKISRSLKTEIENNSSKSIPEKHRK